MDVLAELRILGWYLSEEGLTKVTPPNTKCNDVNEIIKLCLDSDFREIAVGALSARKGDTLKGPIVLQLQWARNIAAPKISETSSGPRMLCLELTDGLSTIKAIEVEKVPLLDLNIPPGTKIRFKQLQLQGGFIILKNSELQVLGGYVSTLADKWEFARSMHLYSKNGRRISGTTGPPPWVAFGKNLNAVTENTGLSKDKNFKSLQISMEKEKEKENKDNEEFKNMRNEAIAEAAKAGTKKVFGGGSQQILDYNIKKILDKGYSEEEARQFLRATNNNLERALYNLKRRQESKQSESSVKPTLNSNARSGPTGRDTGTRRGASKISEESAPTKPVGNISLFDFLTDKLPANSQKPTASNETKKPIMNKQSPPRAQPTPSTQETKVCTSSTQGSSQQHRQTEQKNSRYPENQSRQQSSRYAKPDSANESNKKERYNGGASGGTGAAAGGSLSGSGMNYINKQNGRGNRNSYDSNETTHKRSGEVDRGSRKPLANANNNRQNNEANANAHQSSTHESAAKPKADNQNSSRSSVNRNQQQNRHQQQNTNASSQKQNNNQRQRTQPNSISASKTNVVVAPNGQQVSSGKATTNVAPTTLPNGFAYDPSKIIGFQSKEANEYAMNLMRSQGKSMAADTVVAPLMHPLSQQKPMQQPLINFPPQLPPASMPAPIAAIPMTVAAPPHQYSLPNDAWNWKIGDLCMAKYWEDGQYYEAEITGICDKTCVVYYIGYNNHEEVLKADCLPITDANHRPINNYNLQQAMQVPPPQQQHQHQHQQQPMRTAMRYYVPPHKRNH